MKRIVIACFLAMFTAGLAGCRIDEHDDHDRDHDAGWRDHHDDYNHDHDHDHGDDVHVHVD